MTLSRRYYPTVGTEIGLYSIWDSEQQVHVTEDTLLYDVAEAIAEAMNYLSAEEKNEQLSSD